MPGPFSDKQIKFVRAFAETLFDGFEMKITIDQVVANFETQFELIGRDSTPTVTMGKVLDDLSTVMNWVWGFERKKIPTRRKIVDQRLRFAGNNRFQDAARLRAVIYGAYYGHWEAGDQTANRNNPVHRQIGFTLPFYRTRGEGEMPIVRVEGREIDPTHILLKPDQLAADYDVIVIGSGSGGGVAAWNMAVKHGRRVLVIEAGAHWPSAAITHEERLMGARLFKHGTLQSTTDSDIVIFQGQNVGGSPTINNGICLRIKGDPLHNATAFKTFDVWKNEFGVNIETPMMKAYDDVRDLLGIGEAEKRSGKGNGNHLFDAWNAFKPGRTEPWVQQGEAGWFVKNYGPPKTTAACAYCGYCNTGCPYARKLAPAQTYLKWACDGGARILAESKAERIMWGPPGADGKLTAIGVEVIVGKDKVRHTIRVKRGVVVAAGTIASSKLLQRSKIDGTGDHISLNVASPMIALMHDAPVPPAGFHPAWDEDQMTTAVDCGGFLLESHFQPPQSMAMLMPGWYEEMDRRMKAYGRVRSAGILVPIDRRGTLKGEELKFDFKASDLALLRLALKTLAKVHFAHPARALEVWPALRTGEALIRPANDSDIEAYVDAFFERTVVEKDDITLSSAHPHGGNRMHENPDEGVVDAQCMVHAATNVMVADASVFPSSIRVNAHFTTMALAQYATGNADPFA